MVFNWIYDIYLKKEDINNTYIRDTNILRVLILKKKKFEGILEMNCEMTKKKYSLLVFY